jgi:hypothetical protein
MFRIRTFFLLVLAMMLVYSFFLMFMLLFDDAPLDGLWISLYIVGMNDSICVHRMFRTFSAADWAVGCWAASGGTSIRDTGLDPSWPTR